MALNSDIAFKFGCGRYIQEQNAIEKYLATELKRFGEKPLLICGKNGYRVAGTKIENVLRNADIPYSLKTFESTPCPENADELADLAKSQRCDIICGVGGGVLGDTAKLVAERADLPLVQIPTSSATCVAATPLSVMYDRDTHACLGSLKLMKEADAVLVDLNVMIEQPPRLFWAGVMDAKAKMIEITHRIRTMENFPLGFEMAYEIARKTYAFYTEKHAKLLDALTKKEITEDFELAIFYAIGVTGIISGIAKGSNQCALAHKFYEEVRTSFYEEAKDFVHGELVAMGLIVQLAYNDLDYTSMISELKEMRLPVCLSDIRIPVCEKNMDIFVAKLCNSSAVMDNSDEAQNKVRKALGSIYG